MMAKESVRSESAKTEPHGGIGTLWTLDDDVLFCSDETYQSFSPFDHTTPSLSSLESWSSRISSSDALTEVGHESEDDHSPRDRNLFSEDPVSMSTYFDIWSFQTTMDHYNAIDLTSVGHETEDDGSDSGSESGPGSSPAPQITAVGY